MKWGGLEITLNYKYWQYRHTGEQRIINTCNCSFLQCLWGTCTLAWEERTPPPFFFKSVLQNFDAVICCWKAWKAECWMIRTGQSNSEDMHNGECDACTFPTWPYCRMNLIHEKVGGGSEKEESDGHNSSSFDKYCLYPLTPLFPPRPKTIRLIPPNSLFFFFIYLLIICNLFR